MHQSPRKIVEKLNSKIAERLPHFSPSRSLALSVQKLSNLYSEPHEDLSRIWENSDLAQAYISYFLPLNLLRLKSVFDEGQALGFFADLEEICDVGSGPGTVDLALAESLLRFRKLTFVEKSGTAVDWHRKFITELNLPNVARAWFSRLDAQPPIGPKTLLTFSYALNEFKQAPRWISQAEALLIIEPATQHEGRRLQELRQQLIDSGFFAWAPCLHQQECPLLKWSKTDWCHQRIHVDLPSHQRELEALLPMKNQTLTFSYLLMRRTPPPARNEARVIGDTLYERGKIRQAVCRGSRREFLSWLTRNGEPDALPRGHRISIPAEAEEKGNEIRMPEAPKDSK